MRAALAFLAGFGSPAPVAAQEGALLVAERITHERFTRLGPGGADATGGVGDWALSNGRLCAVVADPSHESELAARGGALIDLGHCGRGDDQLVLLQPLANLDRGGAVDVARIEATVDAQEARLTSHGTWSGCEIETRYTLDRRDPARLRIESRVERREAGARLFAIGDIALHAQHALRPFAFDTRRVAGSGYEHPAVDLASPYSIARATRADDTRLLIGAQAIEPGIAYALRWTRAERQRKGREPVAVPVLALSAENFSGFAAFVAPFWTGADSLGLLQMLQTLVLDLAPGDTLLLEREVRVSPWADAASLLDPLLPDASWIRAQLSDPQARVVVRRRDGRIATEARPHADGSVRFRLAPGSYRLAVLGGAGGSREQALRVEAADLELGLLDAPPTGVVELPRDAGPMRLSFLGLGDTPDPRFGDERPAVSFGDDRPPPSGLTRDVSLAGVASDPASVRLAPGRYRVLAGRGITHELTETRLEITPGSRVRLAIDPPPRALATPGWLHADLHVHAAPSDDSALPLEARLASYVAEGCEVLVATDHDQLTDYGPSIRALGLSGAIASVVGQEVTSSVSSEAAPHTFGHANAFPLPHRASAYRGGALANEARRLRDVVAMLRSLGGERLLQLNHPRSGGDGQGFFDHLAIGQPFDPDLPLTIPPNAVLLARDAQTGLRDVDFDAMELLNGPRLDRYRANREDWFALLRHGIVRTGTANSDSHLLREVAAVPRNLVRLDAGGAEGFDEAAFVAALRAGRVTGTTGPILDTSIGDTRIGELHRGADAELRVEVRAASWVPVETVRVFVDGIVVHEVAAGRNASLSVPLHLERDAFVTVEAEGDADDRYAARLPGFVPIAFTNPIFVDADGDGRWTAPSDPSRAGARDAPSSGATTP